MDGSPVKGPGTDRILLFQELGLFPWLTVARNVELDAKGISVTTRDDTVTLTGTVRSCAERDDASRAAWNAPGVRFVNDELVVKL